ncbi:MAG: winged helix-turn-helix domain-containing protein [Gaiellaceae bacterium]
MTIAAPPHVVRSFAGRERELQALTGLLSESDSRVVYLHAIAGMGKSALLQAFLESPEATDAEVLRLDCRTVEPTERGFLQATGSYEKVEALAERLGAVTSRVVLVLDHYEVFRLMDTWLRQILVPALPEQVTLVLASREPPVAGWFAVPGFQTVPLGPLGDAAAFALLERGGVTPSEAPRLNRIARGHPLALVLASAGVAEHPELALEDAAMTRVVAELTRLYLEDVDDPLAREALEAASVVRRATAPLLAAMLENGDGTEAVRRLVELPFVEAGRDGLFIHDAVREAVGGFLRGTNPARYRAFRRAAWRELRNEIREAPAAELWRYTADTLYLVDNPVVREAFFPSGAQPLAVEPAKPEDGAAVRAIAGRHEGPEAAQILERWWTEAPQTFSVVRDRDDVVVGFLAALEGRMLRPPLVAGDPVVEAWARHLREHPLPKGQIALGLRRWLDVERGELPCASQAACWLDVKRTYMVLRPALRRMYVVVQDVATYWPIVEKLAFQPIPEATVTIDGVEYASVQLDFGPGSVDGWLAGLVEAELGLGDEPALDQEARELPVNGERISLTPLEFGLFSHLREREGRTVSRRELLHEVWGTDFAGGSNVVDAVVRSLRRKLGPAAVVVETLRGSGYRLRSDWRSHLG